MPCSDLQHRVEMQRVVLAALQRKAKPLNHCTAESLNCLQVELWASCRRLVFQSAGRVLFGEAFFSRHGMEDVQREFLTFEDNFEV
jgi:hypothetical protein